MSRVLDNQGRALRIHVDKKVGAVEARQGQAEERLTKHDQAIQDLREEAARHKDKLEQLEKAAALPELSPVEREKAAKALTGAGRDPYFADPTILRINASNLVAKTAVQELVDQMCADGGVDKSLYDLRGPDLGRRFTLAFAGDANTAARRASKCNSTLRGTDGKWKELTVATPGGQTERIYVSRDECTATIRQRKGAKLLHDLVVEKCARAALIKRDHAIAIDWQIIATVHFDRTTNATRIDFDDGVAAKKGLDTADLERRWEEQKAERARG